MTRNAWGWTAAVLLGTMVLSSGVFLALERAAFGAETPARFQRFLGVLTAFAPFLMWLGLGQTWEHVRKEAGKKLGTTQGSLALCAVLLILGSVLILVALGRTEYEVRCLPQSATVSLNGHPVACDRRVWGSPVDQVIGRNAGFEELRSTAGQLLVDGGVLQVQLTSSPSWQCRVEKEGRGEDSADWCRGRPMRATTLKVDVDRKVRASGSELRVVPVALGYIKVQTPESCFPFLPRCLDLDPNGGDCHDRRDPMDRRAEIPITNDCLGTDRYLEFTVVHCGVEEAARGDLFALQVTEENHDVEAITCRR